MPKAAVQPKGIKEVFKFYVYDPNEEFEKKLKSIREKIDVLDRIDTKKFFAFESADEEKEELLGGLYREQTRLEMAQMGFGELEYENFLGWMKKDTKLPALMVLPLDSNKVTIEVDPYNKDGGHKGKPNRDETLVRIYPDLPRTITELIRDSVMHLAEISATEHEWETIQITAELRSGLMPSDLREKVVSLANKRYDLFVIAEAPEWVIEKTVRQKGDPLVVIWVSETDQMFLIGSYNPTNLEKYIEEQMIK